MDAATKLEKLRSSLKALRLADEKTKHEIDCCQRRRVACEGQIRSTGRESEDLACALRNENVDPFIRSGLERERITLQGLISGKRKDIAMIERQEESLRQKRKSNESESQRLSEEIDRDMAAHHESVRRGNAVS